MKSIVLFILLLNVVNAADGDWDTDDFEELTLLNGQYKAYNHDPNPFINCSSYFASRRKSANTSSSGGLNKTTPIDKANSTFPSFEDYWCSKWAYSYAENPGRINEGAQFGPRLPDLNDSSKSFCSSVEAANYSSWAVLPTSSKTWLPVTTTPCCNPFCSFEASAVELLYWSTQYTTPTVHNVTTAVGPDGFTFTSPSIYLVYKGLSASGPCGIKGPTHARLTLPYLKSDVSTWRDVGGIEAVPINLADLFSNCTSRSPGYDPFSTLMIPSNREIDKYEYDILHCYPSVLYPKGLQTVESAWARCSLPEFDGDLPYIFDPPRILTPAAALAPVPTKNPDLQGPTKTATPAPQPSQLVASKTAHPKIPSAVGESALQTPQPLPSKIAPPKHPSVVSESGRETPDKNFIDPGISEDAPTADPGVSYNVIIPSIVVIAGSELEAGVSATQFQGHQISSDPTALIVTADGQAHTLPPPDPSLSSPVNDAPATMSVTAVDGHEIQALLSADVVLIASQTIARGKATMLAFGISAALHPNGDLILGTSTVQGFSPPSATLAVNNALAVSFATTVDGHKIQVPASGGGVLVDSETISAGKGPLLIYGISAALHSNGDLVLGSSTVQGFAPPSETLAVNNALAASFVTTVDGHKIQVPASGGGVLVDSQTISPGKDTVLVAEISAAFLSNGVLVLGTSTVQSFSPPSETLAVNNALSALFATTVDGHRIQVPAFGGGVLVDSQTISPGKDFVLVSGISAALHSNADLVLDTSTLRRIFPPSASFAVTLTVAGHLFTAFANNVAINGETLTRNARPITVSGTPVLLGLDGLVVGTLTVPLPTLAPESITAAASRSTPILLNENLIISSTIMTSPAPTIRIAGNLVSVAGTTLRVGSPAVTIMGTPLALESSALVVGTSTIPIQTLAPSPLPGIGDFIYSAINGGLEAPTSTVPVSSEGVMSQAQDNSTKTSFGDGERVRLQPLALVLVITIVSLAVFGICNIY